MSDKPIDVRYVAELARIALSDEEVAQFQPQLESILKYAEQLQKADVSGIEPTAHAVPVFNVFREDSSREGLPREKVLSNAPHAANGLIVVTRIVE